MFFIVLSLLTYLVVQYLCGSLEVALKAIQVNQKEIETTQYAQFRKELSKVENELWKWHLHAIKAINKSKKYKLPENASKETVEKTFIDLYC